MGILDLKAKINNNDLVNVEMQRQEQSFYTKRVLLYASSLLRGQLSIGDSYQDIKDVIMINILDFIKFDDIPKVHTIWRLREDDNLKYESLPGLEIHFIELPKFRKLNPNVKDKLNQWLALIDSKNDNLMEEAMRENYIIKNAKDKIDEFTADDDARELIEMHEKWQLDYNSAIRNATENGLAKGIEKGIKEGLKKGRKKGHLEEKISIAKNMLNKNCGTAQIAEFTGLDESEILKLKVN